MHGKGIDVLTGAMHDPQHGVHARRTPRLAAACLTVAAATAALLGAGGARALAAGPGATPPPTTCSGVVRIDALAFAPAEIAAGQSSTATLVATNCTGQPQNVSETWAASWVSASTTGIPAGCPVIDPLSRQATFAPHARAAASTGYLVFAGCTADALRLTVTVSQSGVLLGRASATLLIDHPVAAG
ncbi:hypothetical protein V2S66_10430 [Streptomyces sp. V4-01]|uniref:Uncharacterized protein n=1 Tax=Actinacidiphila polyblastidii TaxID=3110430 RepID=A0ABU7P989_9ACTN|nr:hypothetical protein [Streptomyces sp. V4-01]